MKKQKEAVRLSLADVHQVIRFLQFDLVTKEFFDFCEGAAAMFFAVNEADESAYHLALSVFGTLDNMRKDAVGKFNEIEKRRLEFMEMLEQQIPGTEREEAQSRYFERNPITQGKKG